MDSLNVEKLHKMHNTAAVGVRCDITKSRISAKGLIKCSQSCYDTKRKRTALSAERGCIAWKTSAPSLFFGAVHLTAETKGDRVKTKPDLMFQAETLLGKEETR